MTARHRRECACVIEMMIRDDSCVCVRDVWDRTMHRVTARLATTRKRDVMKRVKDAGLQRRMRSLALSLSESVSEESRLQHKNRKDIADDDGRCNNKHIVRD